MAVQIEDAFEARQESIGVHPSAQVAFFAICDADETEPDVLGAAELLTPPIYNGLSRVAIEIVERLSATHWKLQVTYAYRESTYGFDTSGGIQHITNSRETVGRYGPAASTELGGAINYDGKSVQGVDIAVPAYSFSETHWFPPAFITGDYKALLHGMTGTVNYATWKGFSPGEVLFLGASGAQRGNDYWEISYRFASQPNQEGLTIGSITGIDKRGWEYLWIQYAEDVDETANVLIQKPIAVYVERVYNTAEFALLGIGS